MSAAINPQLTQLVHVVIPVAVPLIISAIKAEIPKLPGWSLPIIAPILGVLGDQVGQLVGMSSADPAVGAALGLAGVGLREIKDQVQARVTTPPPPPVAQPPKTP